MPTGAGHKRPSVIGVVLAGGLSSRMGCDKAMLRWQGRPLLEHQIATLQAAGVREVLISGARPGYRGIADPVPQAGPVGGIAGVAAACEDAQLLIIPVDMPCLQASLLQRLSHAQPDAGCVRFRRRVLPMRLRLDARCRGALDRLMALSDPYARSLRALQERIGVHELSLCAAEAAQLLDCNTQLTWQEANT